MSLLRPGIEDRMASNSFPVPKYSTAIYGEMLSVTRMVQGLIMQALLGPEVVQKYLSN